MRIQSGLDITHESWRALKANSSLLFFPICSGFVWCAIVATVVSAGMLIPSFGEWGMEMLDMAGDAESRSIGERALGITCLFAIYFVQWFVVVFFNTALVGCALVHFSGGDPTVADGFRIAMKRLPQIFAWALFAAAVGTVLSAIEERLGWLGRIVITLIGLSWAVATYFVVPILAAEGAGPITSVRRSVALLRKTWGEGLTGHLTISLVSWMFAAIVGAVAAIGFATAWALESTALAVVIGVILVTAVVLMGIVTSAMRQVFLAGLYRYASTGQVPRGFSEWTLRTALQPRTR